MNTRPRSSLHPALPSAYPIVRCQAAESKSPGDKAAGNLRAARDQRRLAAIVSADIVGYSLLMGRDDSATLARLKAHRRELIDPKIAEHGGRIVKTTGDGLLLEFASVLDAVRCAIDVQRGMAERNVGASPEQRIEFRIGINAGEIIIDNDDVFGDCVNVAARLQELAAPGGICVSGRVHEDTHGKLDVSFDGPAERQLKNIARPVLVHRILLDEGPNRLDLAPAARSTRPQPAPSHSPSIAVLPLQRVRYDPEREYFTDGVVEEIIDALSRIRRLLVVARNRAARPRHAASARSDRAVDSRHALT